MTERNSETNDSRDFIGLVLARKQDEKIYLLRTGCEPIVLTLVEIRENKARLGIKAPKDYLIMREEILRDKYPKIYSQIRQGGLVTKSMIDYLM